MYYVPMWFTLVFQNATQCDFQFRTPKAQVIAIKKAPVKELFYLYN